MEQIDDTCHQFEQLHQQRNQHMSTLPQQQQPTDPHITTVAFQSLDTVRALHQTVVSLRKALEKAHLEIDSLKKRITAKDDVEEGKKYREQELDTTKKHLDNLLLNIDLIEIIDTENDCNSHIKSQPQNTHNTKTILKNDEHSALQQSTESLISKQSSPPSIPQQASASSRKPTTTKHKHSTEHYFQHSLKTQEAQFNSQLIGHPIQTSFKEKQTNHHPTDTSITLSDRRVPQMASKIDVKIKLTSNFQIDANDTSSETTADSVSETITPRESSDDTGNDKAFENAASGGAAEVNREIKKVLIETTSVENYNGNESTSAVVVTANEGGDEGNNAVGGSSDDDSVFMQDAIPSTSKNLDTTAQSPPHHLSIDNTPRRSVDNDDEVDDIELILSSDDKEYPQEDLVSISYYEPWQLCGQSGTPVLVNFNNISSDNEVAGEQSHEKLLSSSRDHDQFYNAIKENEAQQQTSLESSDSLNLGHNLRRSYDLNSKSVSLEKDSQAKYSTDNGLVRDESFDTFQPFGYQSATGRRWINYNVFQEADISKIGAIEEDLPDKGRRNTCPNPGVYRPVDHRSVTIIHREAIGRFLNNNNSSGSSVARCPLAVKFARSARTHLSSMNNRAHPIDSNEVGPKRSSAVQTEISLSTLPEHWRSESHLMTGLGNGFFTLPSKFIPTTGTNVCKHPLKISKKTREARRVLLSDINFTSMVPELSRSADHLCHGEEQQNIENNNDDDSADYSKGPFLKTPDYANRGITPSMSLTSPGVSQWTVNESSFGVQTAQTDTNWSVQHGDSFDSNGSKLSFGKHNRSRSCPSVRCALCKHRHYGGIKMSESMHYTPRVTFQEVKPKSVLGSLPDLRPECACCCPRSRIAARTTIFRHGDSCGSTESILDEAEDFLQESVGGVILHDSDIAHSSGFLAKDASRRYSENDINKKDFSPSKQTLPFLPKSSKCLKPGHLAKVIAKNGRVVIGRVRYVGPLASNSQTAGIDCETETYVGLQLQNKIGDCNGSFEGRKFFDCDPQHGIFVPFKKIVMAWAS